MPASAPRFSADTLKFLRALKRNNRREWFNAHRDDYEACVRQPMTAIIERLADDFRAFAPELVASPKASMYRIYRDTRFSENKTPYKTHVAAVFPPRGLPKHEGAACTSTCRPRRSGSAAACTRRRRRNCTPSASTSRPTSNSSAPSSSRRDFKKYLGKLEGERLQRVPRGFPKDHAAAEYLKFRQFLAGAEFPPALATSPKFYGTLLSSFS